MIRYSAHITFFAVDNTSDTAQVLKKYDYRLSQWLPPTRRIAKRHVINTHRQASGWKAARVMITWRWRKNSKRHTLRRYVFRRQDLDV